ncbi:unnamed protein product [Chironomus riparius]|uniref:Uncharacterized protein n=1 Tax=Chironomus riparius TaxID=315576 RepID=A0A9N9RU93_9DIPT|nr:unnamed protein product [Chironomus riparius]
MDISYLNKHSINPTFKKFLAVALVIFDIVICSIFAGPFIIHAVIKYYRNNSSYRSENIDYHNHLLDERNKVSRLLKVFKLILRT